MSEPWVGIPEIAEHLGISQYTARTWAKLGEIPGAKIGRSWKFKISDVDAYLSRPKDPWQQSRQSRARRRIQ